MCLHKNVYAAPCVYVCVCVYVFECVCVCALTLAFLHVCLANYALRTNKSGSLAARCSGTLFGAADDDAAALWELRLSRLPGCLFLTRHPPSLSLSTCRVLLPAHFVFRSEPEIIIATWRYPPPRAQLQQEALDEDISEIQRAKQSVEPWKPAEQPNNIFLLTIFLGTSLIWISSDDICAWSIGNGKVSITISK